MIILCCKLSFSCDPSLSSSVTTQQDSFSGYSTNYAFSVALGSSSKSLYVLENPSTPNTAVIRKIKSDDSVSWMTAVSFTPISQGLSVDATETNVYIASNANPLNVCRLLASSGSVVDAQSFSILSGTNSNNIKVLTLSDNSGYYVSGEDGSTKVTFCKYLFSSSTSASCQQLTNIVTYAFGQLKLSDTQIFLTGTDSSNYNLHLYKITFANTSPDWAMKIVCSSSPCSAFFAESHVDSGGSKIYSAFTYGSVSSSLYYLYFTSLSVSSGSVLSTRYRSNISCPFIYGSAMSGDYIAFSANCPIRYLLIVNTASSSFSVKLFSGAILFGGGVDSTGRMVFTGQMSTNGYITRFPVGSIDYNTDFTTSTALSMTALSSGTDDIVTDSGQTLGSAGAQIVTASSYTNQTVTYSLVSSTCYKTISIQLKFNNYKWRKVNLKS